MIRYTLILAAVIAYVGTAHADTPPGRVWTCSAPRPLAMGGGTVRECHWEVR